MENADHIFVIRGGFRGTLGRTLSSVRDSTTCGPKGSPLCTILRYPFFADGPSRFSKGASGANIY